MKTITINEKQEQFPAGLTSGAKLYEIANCGEQCLYLSRNDKIDIPILPNDFVVIHGGENFVVGKPDAIEDNPPLRNPACPEFNGKKEISLSHAKILAKELKAKDNQFPQGRMFVDIKEAVDMEIKDDMRLIIQDNDSYFIIPAGDGADEIDVEECSKHDRRPPKGHKYRIRIDGEKYTVPNMIITGAAILALVDKSPPEWALNQKLKGGKREPIALEQKVDLSSCGVERFETVKHTAQAGNEQ